LLAPGKDLSALSIHHEIEGAIGVLRAKNVEELATQENVGLTGQELLSKVNLKWITLNRRRFFYVTLRGGGFCFALRPPC